MKSKLALAGITVWFAAVAPVSAQEPQGYFAGHGAERKLMHDTAWVYKGTLQTTKRGEQ